MPKFDSCSVFVSVVFVVVFLRHQQEAAASSSVSTAVAAATRLLFIVISLFIISYKSSLRATNIHTPQTTTMFNKRKTRKRRTAQKAILAKCSTALFPLSFFVSFRFVFFLLCINNTITLASFTFVFLL